MKLDFLPKAIIFDVDETLVYYEDYNHREWFEKWVLPELKRRGMELDYKLYSKTARLELPRSYVKKLGIDPVEMWKVIDSVNLRFRRAMVLKGRVKRFQDVDAMEEIRILTPKLLTVTNASEECSRFVLNLFDLEKYFDLIVGKDYSNIDGVKPNPYLIEKALKAIGVSPRVALLVGDSINDVKGGRRAGVRVVNLQRFGRVEGADFYARTLWEIVEALEDVAYGEATDSGL